MGAHTALRTIFSRTLMSTSNPYPSTTQNAAAIVIAASSVLVTGIQPVMIGALLDQHRIELAQVGQLAMMEVLMLAAGIMFANFLLPTRRLRLIALIFSAAGCALNLLSMLSHNGVELISIRAATGFTEGVLVWVGTSVVVRSRSPSPLFAVSALLQLLTQSALAALMSVVAVPKYGWQSVFLLLSLCSLTNVLVSLCLPSGVTAFSSAGSSEFRWLPKHIRVLLVAFLQVAAIGALWAYIEPVGQSVGFTSTEIQSLISVTLAIATVGAVGAMLTVQRLQPALVVVLSSAALAAISLLMYETSAHSQMRFGSLLVIFQVVGVFVLPFQAALAFSVEPTGRVTTMVPLLQLLGQALGPLFASWTIVNDDAKSALLMCAAIAFLAILLMARLPRRTLARA